MLYGTITVVVSSLLDVEYRRADWHIIRAFTWASINAEHLARLVDALP